MAKKKKGEAEAVEATSYRPTLNVDSVNTEGMQECEVGDHVTLAVTGEVMGIRKKDQYEKGKGLIYNVEIDKVEKINKKGQKPRNSYEV